MKRASFLRSLVVTLAVAACNGAGAPTDPDSMGGGGKGDCATCSDLAANDRLRIASQRETQRWNDQNITTGTAWMSAGRLASTSDADIQTAVSDSLRSAYASDESKPLPSSATITVGDLVEVYVEDLEDELVVETADRVSSDGFSYASANAEGRAWNYWALQHTLDWLPSADASVVGITASASVDEGDGPRNITLTMFVNKSSREFLKVYVREGTI
jgi:hypothetical protein